MTDHPDIVERLQKERRPTAWTRGVDLDYPTAWEPHPLCQEAAAEITRLRAEIENVANEYADACHLVAQMHHAATGYTQGPKLGVVEDVAALRAEAEALRKDAEQWLALYRRAINEAYGLTNYVEDRPELRSAEKRIAKIDADARAAIAATTKEQKA